MNYQNGKLMIERFAHLEASSTLSFARRPCELAWWFGSGEIHILHFVTPFVLVLRLYLSSPCSQRLGDLALLQGLDWLAGIPLCTHPKDGPGS